jgi:hypothetical protein
MNKLVGVYFSAYQELSFIEKTFYFDVQRKQFFQWKPWRVKRWWVQQCAATHINVWIAKCCPCWQRSPYLEVSNKFLCLNLKWAWKFGWRSQSELGWLRNFERFRFQFWIFDIKPRWNARDLTYWRGNNKPEEKVEAND